MAQGMKPCWADTLSNGAMLDSSGFVSQFYSRTAVILTRVLGLVGATDGFPLHVEFFFAEAERDFKNPTCACRILKVQNYKRIDLASASN